MHRVLDDAANCSGKSKAFFHVLSKHKSEIGHHAQFSGKPCVEGGQDAERGAVQPSGYTLQVR